ncbi:MAG: Nif3-like dinuclear metal center hexameric protein [Clostridiales bacterium]|nr:Nif3-like dinuclear metal center hexameric protein [Candidatus Equinaster intestinalis]
MKVKDIYCYLDEICPFKTALDFDNAGLLIGDMNSDVTRAIVTLDCTADTLRLAEKEKAELIITHHPVIFEGIKKIEADGLLAGLIKGGISVISAHTNLDIAAGGVNDCLCDTLGLLKVKEAIGENGYSFRFGILKKPLSPEEFAEFLKEKLKFSPRFVCGKNDIKKVAVCGGAGADCLNDAINIGCDAFVTSEVKHHVFLEAYAKGMSLFDCGHFATEDVVIEPLSIRLKNKFEAVSFITEHGSNIRSL